MRLVTPAPECPCRPLSARKLLACYRTSNVPPGADAKAVKAAAPKIVRDMVRMRRILMVQGMRAMRSFLTSHFTERIEAVVARVNSHFGVASIDAVNAKAQEILPNQHREIWRQAIEEVLGRDAALSLLNEYLPQVQSVTAKAHEGTTILLGGRVEPQSSALIYRRAQMLARRVTSINDVTRQRLATVIATSIDEGKTVAEVAKDVMGSIPEVATSRVPTIVRTEVGRAVDEGTKQALRDSSTVRTVMVIGCQAREPRGPLYRGEPTCNITGVPVQDVDLLEWHANHTGTLCPETFW